jgi:hypothetical protein
VLLSPSGAVLDLGRLVRLASAAQRKALIARDGGCVMPGCDMPPERCEVHHVVAWAKGGRTDLDNECLQCGRDHTAVHAGIWQIVMRDGVPWVRPPAWVDPQRRLLRNTTHQARQHARRLGQQLRLGLDSVPEEGTGSTDPPTPPPTVDNSDP